MDGAEAPPGQECGGCRTDGRDKKRIAVTEAAGRGGHHEKLGLSVGARRRWRPFPDEVSQDLEDLRGVSDYGEDFHGLETTRAGQGIRLVDLLDQAGPCGATLLGGHGELGLRLFGRTDADGWSGWMVALPALGSEAQEVWATGPRATSPRGVQPISTNETVSRIGQVLEGGEELHVGSEVVGIRSAIDHRVRAPLVE
jgi:hypothetical protein